MVSFLSGPARASHLWYCERVPCWHSSIECGIGGPFLLSYTVLDSLPCVTVSEVRKIRPHFLAFNMYKGELLVLVVWDPPSTFCTPSFTLPAAVWAVWIFLIWKVFSYRMLLLQSCNKMAFPTPLLKVSAPYGLLAIFTCRWSQWWCEYSTCSALLAT